MARVARTVVYEIARMNVLRAHGAYAMKKNYLENKIKSENRIWLLAKRQENRIARSANDVLPSLPLFCVVFVESE